ncbi:alpha/beta hydrolase [Nocardia sp. NPDC049149]|uniref:alpha/beta hydrolase n=1 Tax=Nocardia sp. NPDC049149 TaxID=3364315 RepID=UPI00371E5EE8
MSLGPGNCAERRIVGILAIVAMILVPISYTPASAQPSAEAVIDHITPKTDQWEEVYVRSPAMGRVVQLDVLIPKDQAPHPTYYLLDGDGGSTEQSTWTAKSDVVSFFADKPVNVVMPVGGVGTFYTDWLQDDPKLGHNMWETFLTRELPPLLDNVLHGNGINAIGGISMGAHAAAALTVRNPLLYRAVASYSGCLISSRYDYGTVRSAVTVKGGNPDNMWGPAGNPEWDAHDPSLHLEQLRGKAIYLSSGTGLPGPSDFTYDPDFSYPVDTFNSIVLETVVHDCTVAFDEKLKANNVAATVRYSDVGTHWWPYWQAALHDSWATLKVGLGL